MDALKYLLKNKNLYIQMINLLETNRGEIIFSGDEGVLIREKNSGICMLTANSAENGEKILENLEDGQVFTIYEDFMIDYVKEKYKLKRVLACAQFLYLEKNYFEINSPLKIRVLDENYIDLVLEHYHTVPDYWYIESRIKQGAILGGFLNEKLCGFIGIHDEGSIGMLEIFEEYRRNGFAEVLEKYMINEILKCGKIPFTHVFLDNEPSIKLQNKLGLKVCEEKIFWLS